MGSDMDDVEKRVVNMLRRFDPTLMSFTDEEIFENWGNTLFFKRVAFRIALDDLQKTVDGTFIGKLAKWIKNKI